MLDRQTSFHSTPHIGINASQTDGQTTLHFILPFEYMKDRRKSTFHFTNQIGIYARQTGGQATLHFIQQMWIQDKLPSYWNLCKINEQTFHFTTSIGIQDRKTDNLRFISPSNLNLRTTDRRTNYVSFHPSNWNSSKTDGQTTIHLILSYWILRNTDGHIMRYVILQLKSSQDRQTDKLRFISILKLESKFDRRTNYVFFHPSYCNLSKTDRRTNYVSFDSSYCSFRQTDKLRFISSIKCGSKTNYPPIGIFAR